MTHAILGVCIAALAAVSIHAGAHELDQGTGYSEGKHPETITPVFNHALPNAPGKALIAVEVLFPPGANSPAHTHPKSAFVFGYVLAGEIVSAVDGEKPRVYRAGESWYESPGAHHLVTRNPSTEKPAKLLAIFVADPGEKQLVLPVPK